MAEGKTYYLGGEGERIVRFGERYIVQTKGRWANKPIVHEPWQKQFLREAFLRKENGERVYKRVLLGIGRKNGKSTLLSELALYHLIATGEASPEVYAAAASKDQARIVYRQAREFVEASPKLSDFVKAQQAVMLAKNKTGGIFRALSSDAALQYGLNPYFTVIDELFAHANPDLYYALTTADIARENPMCMMITTAGFDRESLCYQLYEEGKAIRDEGGIEAMRKEGFLFWWYEAPLFDAVGEPVDYRDQATWKAANPSSWITLERLEEYQRRFPEPIFRQLHLNQWTESEESWIKPWQWDQMRGTPIINSNEPIWMGLDIGYRKDSTAIVWAQWHDNKLHIGHEVMLPAEDATFGISDVQGKLVQIAKMMQDLREIAFDPFQFLYPAEQMMERGFPMVEFPQTSQMMEPASDTLFQLIQEGRIVHDGNREVRSQVLNAVAAATERGLWRISKRKSLGRIDVCIALALAAERATAQKGKAAKRRVVHL